MQYTRHNELHLRNCIVAAFAYEEKAINDEIAGLRRKRTELRKLIRRARTAGRRAYIAQEHQNTLGKAAFVREQTEAANILRDISNLGRGYSAPAQELNRRHVDLWVTLKTPDEQRSAQ